MPDAAFFSKLGLFLVEDFFDAETSARLCAEMSVGVRTSAAVVDGYSTVERHKANVRQTKNVTPTEETSDLVRESLRALRPRLEKYFDLRLRDCEKPQFLIYEKGDFFRPHHDADQHPSKPEYVRKRAISVVVNLNGEDKRAPACYSGGSLIFYGLVQKPHWDRFGFPLVGKRGLLIAFPSTVLHEVTIVNEGSRFTVVTWFYQA